MTGSTPAEVRVVLTTAPSEEVAERLARTVVEERLAACANLVPRVSSIFRWDGEVRRETEVLIVLKTVSTSQEALRKRLVDLHPYDVPEVLELEVASGHAPYLVWVRDEVESAP